MITTSTTTFYRSQADKVEMDLLKVRAARKGNAPEMIQNMLIRQAKEDFRILHTMRLTALHAEWN